MEHPYVVFDPKGKPVLEAMANCRYTKRIELDLIEAGYTIRLHGKKITKKEVR